jgi:ATP-dependent HslUV protease subunit HslV
MLEYWKSSITPLLHYSITPIIFFWESWIMSIAVAVQKDHQLVIASDTQDNFGSNKVSFDNYRSKKIIKVGNSYIATTGWGVYEDILHDYLATKPDVVLESKPLIFAFFMEFWQGLHKKYSFVKDQTDEDHDSPFGGLDATFLIINPQGIFYVSSNMSVTKFEKYFAIGSGADFSLGTMYALYDLDYTAEEIARKAVEAAMMLNVYCGGEIDLFSVD